MFIKKPTAWTYDLMLIRIENLEKLVTELRYQQWMLLEHLGLEIVQVQPHTKVQAKSEAGQKP